MYQSQHFSETSSKKLFIESVLPRWQELVPKKAVSS
jgi:hypothetical protein